ncbi:hypothetical protein GIB67_028907 [Kingdonia uniflora]|uniref:Uncharacterized protein n=1 Tax=Kingdonia uniflora TaxID=39325 RepID=A0A7J7NK35_9MAGN|nr:hypothetical protein GIB67_028907 [Kingdonia uniflora]
MVLELWFQNIKQKSSIMELPRTINPIVDTQAKNYQYQPTIWDCNFIESLSSKFMGETYTTRRQKLKENVRVILKETMETLSSLEMIDNLERLGLGYIFAEEIKQSLDWIYGNIENGWKKENLYATTLRFRVLRQHGYQVSQEEFIGLMDDSRYFKESLREDVKGMLSLYEAAHTSSEDESILVEALEFTRKHLKNLKGKVEPNLAKQVNRSLEVPMHWRMLRSESRWYIDAYEKEKNMNPVVLELAKLDFNMVQATFQKDLKTISRWWRNIDVATKLNFARDRLAESFLATVGILYLPQHSRCREWLVKVMNFVMIIDDTFDIFGSLDELEHFSNVLERWDNKEMHNLPYYMKICFLALYNTINEMAYVILKEKGWDILPYMTKAWANFIKAMLVEAKWCKAGYTPSLQEYLENGWISSSGSVILVHAFFATNQNTTIDILENLVNDNDLLYCASMIFRLSNDLATSSAELERGDTASSIRSYMHESNASEKEAREHIRSLIMNTWRKMNASVTSSPYDIQFVDIAINLARTSLFVYQYGDGIGVENLKIKDHIMSLIANPIQDSL